MDTTLTFTPKAIAAVPHLADREPPKDTKVPAVKGLEGAAALPPDRPFVAQVVSARLAGTKFPESPSEILPISRTLRPYDTPMLPYNDAAIKLEASINDDLPPQNNIQNSLDGAEL